MKNPLLILTGLSALLTLGASALLVWGIYEWWLGDGANIILPGIGLVIHGNLVVEAIMALWGILLLTTIFLAVKLFIRKP